MFVRKKRHHSGTISVVVVDKSSGEFREIESFGVVPSDEDVTILCQKPSNGLFIMVDNRHSTLIVAIKQNQT